MNKYKVTWKESEGEQQIDWLVTAETFEIEDYQLVFRVNGFAVAAFSNWERVIKHEKPK